MKKITEEDLDELFRHADSSFENKDFRLQLHEKLIRRLEDTKKLLEKAMECENPEQLLEFAKAEGIEVTKEEAEAFLAQSEDVELDSTELQTAAAAGNYFPCLCNQKILRKGECQ